MLDKPLAKANRDELDAELALYREAGKEVAGADTLTNKAECATEIERLRAEHGQPVKVDADFLAANPTLAKILTRNGAAEGGIVFALQVDPDEAAELEAEATHRAEVIAELGIPENEATALTTDELEAALEKKRADDAAQNSTEASVCDVKGNVARVYSLEVHGENFRQLAEEFTSKRAGWTVR